jgi:peptidyl-prolyl cis-trans isomerase C
VNGKPITENQVAFQRLVRRLPSGDEAAARAKIVDELIDRELMRQFLADRRAEADPKRLAAAVAGLKERLRRDDRESDRKLIALGYTDAALRRELALPLAWEHHVGRAVTAQTIRDEFERHREQYDGTEVRASQIFLKLAAAATPDQVRDAEARLAGLRARIVDKQITFADAARKHSEAPSREQGGDVGWSAYQGTMPAEIARVVFALKPGEVSRPFRSRFGMHLYAVTDRRPGNLSLEDVRPAVLERVSAELWRQLLEQARAKAKIERRETPAG